MLLNDCIAIMIICHILTCTDIFLSKHKQPHYYLDLYVTH